MSNFKINKDLENYKDEVIKVRRDLHKTPELGFKEFKTKEYLKNYLENLGYNPENLLKTGLLVKVEGNSEGDSIALRADIDGLPILEPKNKDFRSEIEGQMHACGHDGHMTMLLVLAKYLKDHPEFKHPDLYLIFQPAEEGPGGAIDIVDTGLFRKENIKEIYGFHLIPFIDEGIISTNPGPMFAMTSEFYPVIKGKRSHAGEPENGRDALLAGCEFVLALQSIVSRNVEPDETVLINVGKFNSGDAMNIVSDETKMEGTLRSYNPKTQMFMKQRLYEVLDGIDKIYGTKSSLNFVDKYDPVINNEKLFDEIWEVIPEPKQLFEKVMLAEDFSMYQNEVPGVFIGLGTRTDEYNSGLHTAEFNFNEEVLLRGIDTYLRIIEKNV